MDEIFTPDALERLHAVGEVIWARDEPMPEERFLAEVVSADAVVFGGWRHGPRALDNTPRLRALLEVAGGHLHGELGYDAALRRDLLVGSCAPAFADVVAEMALSLALDATRGVATADRRMRAATERWLHDGNTHNTSLFGSTVGFIGCGGISRSLHSLLEPFRVDVLGYDPPMADEQLRARNITPTSLTKIFDRADVLFVLASPTPENRGLVSRELMERLTPTQVLVVISRAHLVDFDALTELVTEGAFKAGVDVFPTEPLPADHPIRSAAGATLVPHIAGALPSALTLIGQLIVDDLERLFAGGTPTRMQYLDPDNYRGLLQV